MNFYLIAHLGHQSMLPQARLHQKGRRSGTAHSSGWYTPPCVMPLRSSGSPANYRKYLLYISGGCVIDSLTCLIYNDRLTVNDILEYDLHSRKRCIDTAVGSVIQVHLLYVL